MGFRRYRLIKSRNRDFDKRGTYLWESFLELTLSEQKNLENFDFFCCDQVVPVKSFFNAPFADYMKHFKSDLKIELLVEDDYANLSPHKVYWLASVLRIVGYRLLVRYVGYANHENEHDVWVHIGSEDIRPVGFSTRTPSCRIYPPISIENRFDDRENLIRDSVQSYRTLISNWPDIQLKKLSKFKIGEHVELINSVLSNQVRPARIEKVIGNRLLIKVIPNRLQEELNEDGDLQDEDSQLTDGVWLDDDSPLFFYVGWSYKTKYNLSACDEYKAHSKAVAEALKADKATIPFLKFDTMPSHFVRSSSLESSVTPSTKSQEWKKGMKLEVLDPLEEYKELKVATILSVLPDGYLKIGFDGDSLEEDVIPLHSSSPLLFPVGYSKKYGLKLSGPVKNEEIFDWGAYLSETKSSAAPDSLFLPTLVADELKEKFKIGAKLEAVDMCESNLICRATVVGIRGRLLQIHYDGWEDSYDQLFDYRSGNIYPLGWCEMVGYRLEAPHVPVKKGRKRKFSNSNS